MSDGNKIYIYYIYSSHTKKAGLKKSHTNKILVGAFFGDLFIAFLIILLFLLSFLSLFFLLFLQGFAKCDTSLSL